MNFLHAHPQADCFVVRSVTHACELLRLRCGSMRRPFSLHLAAADDFTFAFHRDDRLHLYRRARRCATLG